MSKFLVRSNLNTMSSVIELINVAEFDGDGLDIMGTDGFNDLEGSNLADLIQAKGGSDFIDARGGSDLIDAGLGNDFVYAGTGNDSVLGGGGSDIIFGEQGDDVIAGEQGNDVIFGGKGDDIVYGGEGDDTVLGGRGDDTVIGSLGNDVLFGGKGNDVFEFSAGELDSKFVNRVQDFQIEEDSLVIKGLSSDDQVSLDPSTGHLSVNDDAVIMLKNMDSSAELSMEFNEDGEFEIM